MTGMLRVLATGPLVTVQDLGRPGLAHLGVAPGGAADRASLRQANRLLGNDEGAAALEVLLGGLVLQALGELDVALTGAPCPARVGARDVGPGTPVRLTRGAVLEVDVCPCGLRAYLAVRGGLQIEPVLGSRSTDLLAGLGPAPITPGQELAVGEPGRSWPGVDQAAWLTDPGRRLPLRAVPGPRQDWFADEALLQLAAGPWVVSSEADRSAVVLDGPRLLRAGDVELASEGVVRGSVQVPPSGRPTVLMSDHPVTGGYPVLAVVVDADVDVLAQLRPGADVRLRMLAPVRLCG